MSSRLACAMHRPPAFSPPLHALPSPLHPRPSPCPRRRPTRRRATRPRCPLFVAPRAAAATPQPPEKGDIVAPVAAVLRSLRAEAAATHLERDGSSLPNPLPPAWCTVLSELSAFSVTSTSLSRLLTRYPLASLLSLSAPDVRSVLSKLTSALSLTCAQRARLVSHAPFLLACEPAALSVSLCALAIATTLPTSHLRALVLRVPRLALVPPARLLAAARVLQCPPISLPPRLLRALLRRAPWLLLLDAADVLQRGAEAVALAAGSPVQAVVLANPRALVASPDDIAAVVALLRDEAGLDDVGVRGVLRSFPPLLTAPVASLRPALTFLTEEVGLCGGTDLPHVVRAFPAVLTLDVEKNMRPVVAYFRHDVGVKNVARLVHRLPPVLGYDVESNIRPKVQFIRVVLALPLFELLRFPALLSYPLADRIVPRAAFAIVSGCSVPELGLARIVAGSDQKFCELFVGKPLATYYAFRDRLLCRMRARRAGGAESAARRPRDRADDAAGRGAGDANMETATATWRERNGADDPSMGLALDKVEGGAGADGARWLAPLDLGDDNKDDDDLDGGSSCSDEGGDDGVSIADVVMADEARVWGRKQFRATLVRIPWSDLPPQ